MTCVERWEQHKRHCRGCTRRLAGGNRIEEIPCDVGYKLYVDAIGEHFAEETSRRRRRAEQREAERMRPWPGTEASTDP